MSSLIRSPVPALISDAQFYISGNVTIHPNAVIAPGVMLQADPDSELIVAAGVCIGAGCVLHAHQGRLEVEAGATLGNSVLIVGQGKIGANACIGPMSTIINSSVLPQQMIPPGALVGDGSRQVIVVEQSASESATAPTKPAPPPPAAQSDRPPKPDQSKQSDQPKQSEQPDQSPSPTAPGEVRVVYGRTYLERMMLTMFPHRQPTQEE